MKLSLRKLDVGELAAHWGSWSSTARRAFPRVREVLLYRRLNTAKICTLHLVTEGAGIRRLLEAPLSRLAHSRREGHVVERAVSGASGRIDQIELAWMVREATERLKREGWAVQVTGRCACCAEPIARDTVRRLGIRCRAGHAVHRVCVLINQEFAFRCPVCEKA
jgi:hypothetical protein